MHAEAHKVTLSRGETFYSLHGPEDGELVLCVHGITWWSFCFEPFLPHLINNGYRVLLFDLYGRGESDSPVGVQHNLALFVEQTRELLDALDFKMPIKIIGLSMGGAITAGFASKYPNRVKNLIFMGPAGLTQLPLAAKLLMTPLIGPAIYWSVGKYLLLKTLHEKRFEDSILHPERNPELVADYVQKIDGLINNKPGWMGSNS